MTPTLPVRGGRELGLGGMVNVSELLINAVIAKEPNVLTGSNQNASRGERALIDGASRILNPYGEEAAPNPHGGTLTERGKPITFSATRQPSVSTAYGVVGS